MVTWRLLGLHAGDVVRRWGYSLQYFWIKKKRTKKKEKTQQTWWRHVVGGGSCEAALMGRRVVTRPGNVATAVGLHSLHWGSLVVMWVRWGRTVW
jgi:hypothetical protein